MLLKDLLIHTNFVTMILVSLFYCYEKVFTCMNKWIIGKHQTKEDFYSHLNMKDTTNAGYTHAKRVCQDFEMKISGKYHDLYVQNNTLLLAYVFQNFQNYVL